MSLVLNGCGIKAYKDVLVNAGACVGVRKFCPTILANTRCGTCFKQEIFGPMLLCTQASNLQEAIQLVNSNKYRNWTTILIRSRTAAHTFQHEIDAGQLGSNIPIPVPFPFFSFHRIQGILCWRSELLWAGWCALHYID